MNDEKSIRFRSCLMGTGLVLLPLMLAAVASAGFQGAPVREVVQWDYTPTVTTRYWAYNSTCTGGWNNSSIGCLSWTNTSLWSCGPPYTYLYTPNIDSKTVNARDPNGFATNFTLAGTFNLKPAGSKVLAGTADFNAAYCYMGGNLTDEEQASLVSELGSIQATAETGKVSKYSPAGWGDAWAFTGETVPSDDGREAAFKFGAHSIQVTYASSTAWNTGTHVNTTASGSSLTLTSVGSAANVVGLWHFDEGSGTSTADVGPNANPGTLSDGAMWNTTGATGAGFSGSLDFNKNTYYVDMGVRSVFDETGSQTIELWMRSPDPTQSSSGGYGMMATHDGGSFDQGWEMRFSGATGKPECRDLIGGVGVSATSSDALTADTWYHIACVYNTTEGSLKLFVNGTLKSNQSAIGAMGTGGGGFFSLQIGERNSVVTPYRFWGEIDEVRYSNTSVYWANFTPQSSPFATGTYSGLGNWSSAVTDAGTNYNRWLNWTNASTMAANTGLEWWMRSSNTSFAQTDSTPAFTPLGNGSATGAANLLAVATNISRYAQFRIFLYPDSTGANAPVVNAFTFNFSRLAFNTADFSGNVTYAAPGQPVSLRMPYLAPDSLSSGGYARLMVLNASGGAVQCNNQTFASGNTTSGAYCAFAWNDTSDGYAPPLFGNLTNQDLAWNETNSSRPVTTDSAAPVVAVDSIANTSSGTFALNIHRLDNASGLNRTWFSLTNLTNGTYIEPYSNTTFTGNQSITLCSACLGQIRVSAQADDSVAAGYRHISSVSNVTFFYDNLPVVSNISINPNSTQTTNNPVIPVRAYCDVTSGITDLASVVIRYRDPSLASTDFGATLASGTNASGTWFADVTLGSYGTHSFQCRARTTSTSVENITSFVYIDVVSSGGGGGGGGPAPGGGGGGGGGGQPLAVSVTANETLAQLRNATLPQLVRPIQLAQFLIVSPLNPGQARWSQVWLVPPGLPAPEDDGCRVLVPFGCVVQNKVEPYSVTFTLERAGVDLAWDKPLAAVNTNASIFLKGLSEPVRGSLTVYVLNGKSPVWYPVAGGLVVGLGYLAYLRRANRVKAAVAAARARSR